MRRRQVYAAIAAAKEAGPPIRPHNGKYLLYSHPSIPREEVIEALVNLEMMKREHEKPKRKGGWPLGKKRKSVAAQ